MMKKKYLTLSALLLASFLFLTVEVQSSQGEEDYAGTETCIECHEEIYERFRKSIHGIKGNPRTPMAVNEEFACESCHGPGATHSEEGESGNIFWPSVDSPEPAEKKSATCLDCHTKGKVAMWHSSEHETRDLSCANCHSIHGSHPKNLAKPSQTQVCTPCHKRIRAEMLRQSRHPIREGKIKCSDCHNSHGTIADKLVDAQYINLKCFECHAKTRGPYLWEHPSVVEDCMTCHAPHGSSHSGLLRAKIPYLCQRCHLNSGHAGELQAISNSEGGRPVYVALNNRGFYRGCMNCHNAIHGSNHPSGKSLLR
jgi:DmsE family decaheme c-type cytochrome